MKRIDRTYEYDVKEWTEWFAEHGFEIDHVESVEIGTTVANVYLYVIDQAGHRVTDRTGPGDRHAAQMVRVTFDIKRPEPVASKPGSKARPEVGITAGF